MEHGLIGREPERSWLRRLVADVASGQGGAVVVTGPAGIGKTALLRDTAAVAAVGPDGAAVAEPDGAAVAEPGGDAGDAPVRVAQVAAAVSEQEWPLSGLHLVLSGLRAVQALGGDDEPMPAAPASPGDRHGHGGDDVDTYDVARRTLDLLQQVKEPVLLLVDDAHHLDPRSQEVLGFVARRLAAVPLLLVLATGSTDLTGATDAAAPVVPLRGLHTLELAELSKPDATDLAELAGGPIMLRAVAARIAERVGGNPRALLDVVGRIPDAQRMGQVELDRYLPPSPVLQALHLPELDDLDEEQRFALLVATGDEGGRLAPVLRALADRDASTTRWLLAEHLVPSDADVVLRRPAVRSVIWQAATPAERALAHEALADAYAGVDRGQQLWHLAQARQEDSALAADLHHLAAELTERGQLERAAALAREAVRLTPAVDADGIDRLLLAGELAMLTGRLDTAVQLARERFRRDTTVEQRADLALLEVRARDVLGGEVATGLVTRHAAEVAEADPGRAASLALAAAIGLAGRMEEAEAARFVALAELLAGRYEPPVGDLHRRAAALVASVSGDLRRAVGLVDADTEPSHAFTEADRNIRHAQVLIRAERFDRARRLLEATTVDGRFAESPLLLGAAYSVLSELELRAGRITEARAAVSSWDRVVSGRMVRAVVPAHFVRIHALSGEYEAAWEWRRRSVESARRHGDSWAAAMTQAETGAMLLTLGRFDEAVSGLDHARRYALQHADPAAMAIEPDYVEACLRVGETEHARRALAEFETRALRVPTAWARHAVQRCRALVSDGEDAVSVLEAAAEDPVSPVELTRTRLWLAEWLRRLGRRSEARQWLQRARTLAQSTGAMALAARAEDELRGAGGPGSATVELGDLTDAERRIAVLVAAGRRNREIAAELFVSVRTIEAHLGRIFRKAGVRSRTELARAVVAAGSDDG